jgi:hypothetical protein
LHRRVGQGWRTRQVDTRTADLASSSGSYRRPSVRAAELRTRRLSSTGDFSGEISPIAGASREWW